MSDKKYTLEVFSSYDRTGLENHLEKMAERGWMLEKTGLLWTYRRIEPKKVTFCVCWFPKASAFDPGPSEEQMTFYAFCRHTGWTLAASAAQMQIFYNERENPVPIETDPMMELDAIHRAVKRNTLPAQFLLLALAVLNGAMYVSRLLGDPVGALASTANLFSGGCWVMIFCMSAVEIGVYFSWRRKAIQAAERGEFLETRGTRRFQLICLAVWTAGLGYYFLSVFTSGSRMKMTLTLLMFGLYVPGLSLLVFGIKAFLKRKGASARVTCTVTIAVCMVLSFAIMGAITMCTLYASSHGWFAGNEETYVHNGAVFTAYQDELPLTVEDLLHVDYDGYIRERQEEKSFLLAQLEMSQYPRFDTAGYKEMPRLEYTITLVKFPFLYNLCKNALLADWEDNWRPDGKRDYALPTDPAPWGAQDAYQRANQEYGPENRFLLCYGDRIVEIRFDWEPPLEQMAITGEKLSA